MRQGLFLWIFIIVFSGLMAQSIPGKLMIVGGGSENMNGWSDGPYAWSVNHSENKRVAIITYDTDPSNWLPNYFKNLGAVDAKNFILNNSSVANLQETYDSLVTYNIVFFKGGDQSKYYEYYKSTLTQTAVEFIYENGGVICGTSAGLAILSSVFYSADKGSVYSYEALEDPFNYYMTLENDFFDFMPGYIFDSHFVERARFGRLIGFLGNWEIAMGEKLTGIGVDDKMAFCIDSNLMGYAFGTGAVNIYKAKEDNDFRLSGDKLLANSIEVKQLLHECTIDLNTFEYTGLTTEVEPEYEEFTFFNNLWLSGSDKIYDNTLLLEKFSANLNMPDTILIVTGLNTSTAGFFADYLTDIEKPSLILQAIQVNANNELWKTRIENFGHVLFVNNNFETLMEFFGTWPNGNLLKDLVKNGEKQVAFIGDNSRFAGASVLVNYEQVYASYDGELDFQAGMGLLRNTIVMPKTFEDDIDNENAAAGVPYGMVLENLKYGIWLFDDCFLQYTPNGSATAITSFGEFPMIWLENNGTLGDFSTQSAVSSGEPRDVAGFGSFTLSLVDSTITRQFVLVESIGEVFDDKLIFYPNPAKEKLYIRETNTKNKKIQIFDFKGSIIYEGTIRQNEGLNISWLKPGLYIIKIPGGGHGQYKSAKLIIQ